MLEGRIVPGGGRGLNLEGAKSSLQERLPARTSEELAAVYGAGGKSEKDDQGVASELQAGAREGMGPWVAELAEWVLFPTLTYDPQKVPGVMAVRAPGGMTTERV